MKKEYIKPDAEYVEFYSLEETTTEIDPGVSGSWGEEDIPW